MTNSTSTTSPYVVLRACSGDARAEYINVGIVLFTPDGPLVSLTAELSRLRAFHPDFAALKTDGWAEGLQQALRSFALPVEQQIAMLNFCAHPFTPHPEAGAVALDIVDPQATLDKLTRWLINAPALTLRPLRAERIKKATKLQGEIAAWLKSARLLSSKIEDLSKGRVVVNYPIDPAADLYTDFALRNGELHVIETLDLRGISHLTPTLRGDAAIKGVTLDEARDKVKGKRVAIVSASDYTAAKPAIWMISRSADEVWDMHHDSDRQKFADFISDALHQSSMPALSFKS